ncbi:hypothetical protein [Gottfriedia acidiceleris]|uniref:hypothetical protein n=1 Tax=Gottfriedia acidiceleris TaxID=371036 RepID=UPI003B588884
MIQISSTPLTIRSKEMFKNAVFSPLSEDSSSNNFTVQKAAVKARLNRTTFWLHYRDIQELLMQFTEEIKNDLADKINFL